MYKPEINLAFFGHADQGKSTLAGKILCDINKVSSIKIEELKQRANELGPKRYNEYNLIFNRGRTSTYSKENNTLDDQSRTVFPQFGYLDLDENRSIAVIDPPGSSRFTDNIIYGAYLTDVAILVVEANSKTEDGIINVLKILKSFDIRILAIAITKMDLIDYSKNRFDEKVTELHMKIGNYFGADDAFPEIIPVSALQNEGISVFNKIDWYKNRPLIEVINTIEGDILQNDDKNVFLSIEGNMEVNSVNGVGTVVSGALEKGIISKNSKLILEPISTITAKEIEFDVRSVQYAKGVNQTKLKQDLNEVSARAIVSVALPHLDVKLASVYLKRGGVFGTRFFKPKVALNIVAEIIFFEPEKIYNGKEFVLFTNASHTTISISKIKIKPDDMQFTHTRSDIFKTRILATIPKIHNVYDVELSFKFHICIEEVDAVNRLNRFVLREHNKIIACGRCIKILS